MYKLTILLLAITFTDCKKPFTKRQQAIWRLECNLGVINDVECPVDGGWSPWSSWSACQGSCDDVGHSKRIRKCINPSPSKDGLPCSGPDEQTKSCHLSNCTVDDYRILVMRDATRMESFRQLEAIPVLTERCLQIECPFEAIKASLISDNTWQLTTEAVWNALQCVKHNIGCLVAGEWGNWGSWSACGAQCGKGHRWRMRRCDNPPPSAAHLVCTGCPLQTEECEGDRCIIDNPVNETIGSWGLWGQWSACSENCGAGVRRRKRTCNEKQITDSSSTWGTHCRGPHDELEICQNEVCVQNGGWSGWSSWGPCSQTCGAGKRFRTRSCTRPVPSGRGKDCMGALSEAGSCNLAPCEVYLHSVAVLSGDSVLHYHFEDKRSVLFHFYVRFMSLSPHGTLVRRGAEQFPLVLLSLQKWHVCLDVSGLSPTCGLPRLCSATTIEPANWHSAFITVTSKSASLRLDDDQITIRSTFPCDPELPDEKMYVVVGEKFFGEIQDIILNFLPLNMMSEKDHTLQQSDVYPSSITNVAFQNSNQEEAYLILNNDQYLRIPCFHNQNEWNLDLTVKPTNDAGGTLLFLHDTQIKNWFSISLHNCRVRIKLAIGDFRSESSSSDECPFDQWLDIAISKKKDSNTIEASINSGEILHVSLVEEVAKRRRSSLHFDLFKKAINIRKHNCKGISTFPLSICEDEFYLGGVPNDIKNVVKEDFIFFSGIIASLKLNGILQDLHSFNKERYKEDTLQVSSRSASVSSSYHEVAWGVSNRLNLTCLHARNERSTHSAQWLFLDTTVHSKINGKLSLRSIDDGKLLKLVAKADNDLRGFYTCRAHSNRRTRNIVTYGVIGKIKNKLSGPDTTTAIAVVTTIILVIGTLGWLVIEGLNDLRTGYGFYRDAHLTPQQEAEAVCKYIDDNINMYSNKSDAKAAKALARRRGMMLASHASFGAQEPQGMQADNENTDEVMSSPETEMPALAELKTPMEKSHEVFICKQNQNGSRSIASSSRRGSYKGSPRYKSMSCSSLAGTSPRMLCTRLFLTKRINSSKESVFSRKSPSWHSRTSLSLSPQQGTSPVCRLIKMSPVQRVLHKFQQLKSEDP